MNNYINIKGKQYPIFNERYIVVIGERGGVKVVSNVGNGTVLKVYGRKKDNLRFVNLTVEKGSQAQSYRLSDLGSYALKEIQTIEPLTESEVVEITESSKPPALLDEYGLIECLPTELGMYNTVKYVEEIEGFKRYYSKINFTNTSNGFLQFNYKVSTFCEESKLTTNSSTKVFTDRGTILIKNVHNLDNDTRKEIIKLLQDAEHNEE